MYPVSYVKHVLFLLPTRLLDQILSQVFPLSESTTALIRRSVASNDVAKTSESESCTSMLLGAVGTCRQLLPHLADLGDDLEEAESVHERSLQLYELCLQLVFFKFWLKILLRSFLSQLFAKKAS
jgi:hypothetical protein